MAVTIKQFNGQLGNTKATIVSASQTTIIFNMSFHNTNASSETIEVWLNDGTNSRKIASTDVATDASLVLDSKYTLNSTGLIEAQSTTASVVDFWISVAEIT